MPLDPILETLKNTIPLENAKTLIASSKKSLSQGKTFKEAIIKGNLSDVQKWIDKGVDVNQSWGKTNPLYLTIKNKNESMAQLLFASHARLDKTEPTHHLLWKTVGKSNNLALAQILLDCKMNPGLANEWWDVASWMGNSPEFIRFWLDKNQPIDFGIADFKDSIPPIALALNVEKKWIEYLLKNATEKESVLFQKKMSQSIYLAKYWEKAKHEVWEELIKEDNVVMLHHYLNLKITPPETYEDLVYPHRINQGNKPINYESRLPSWGYLKPENYIKTAIKHDSFKTLNWFKKSPELMSQFIESWNTNPFPEILGLKKHKLIKELIENGLDIEKTNGRGQTILHYYAAKNQYEGLKNKEKWFTLCSSLLDVKDNEGVTPLDLMQLSEEEKVQVILNYRVNKAPLSASKPLRL